MGTRCLIRFNDSENETGTMIYKHWDGYPSATVPWLVEKIKDFTEKRSNSDYSYFVAYLLKSISKDSEKFGLDDSLYTGWGFFKDDGLGKNNKLKDKYGVDYVYSIDLKDGIVKIGDSEKYKISVLCPIDEKLLKKLERA